MALGGSNTIVTYMIMLALTGPLTRASAYSAAFAVGVAINALATGPLVFGSRLGFRRVIGYAVWLVLVYLMGLAVLRLATELQIRPMPLAMVAPLLLTVPFSFAGARLILSDQGFKSKGI